MRADAERHGARVDVEAKGDLNVRVQADRDQALPRQPGRQRAAPRQQRSRSTRRGSSASSTSTSTTTAPASPPSTARTCSARSYRLDEARNQDEGGSGLGLAIARDVARSHGGEITLSTSPLGGLRACVRLPI